MEMYSKKKIDIILENFLAEFNSVLLEPRLPDLSTDGQSV